MFQNAPISAFSVLVYGVLLAIYSSEIHTQSLLNRVRRQSPCKPTEYTCANRECILSYNVCDGPTDCSDGSDETSAACKSSGIRCPSFSFVCSYGACINKELRCDGKTECADGSDEQDCQSQTHIASNNTTSSSCGPGQFKCSNGQCINSYDTCDGTKNCNDGSDETRDLCSRLICPSSSFQCDYGACLERSVKCNGHADCPDGSDELGCSTEPTTHGDNRPVTPTDGVGSCQLPNHPTHGVYVSSQCVSNDARPACRNYPGTLVPHTWLLKYTCNANYSLNRDSEYSICDNGIWKNPVDCIKLCPPLKSLSVSVKCTFGGREVSCDRPMRPDTTATAECRQHYRPAYVPEYSTLLCLASGDWSYPLFHCTPDCGVSFQAESLTTLIISGSTTRQGEFPWLAALYYPNSSDLWEQKCAGSLITPHIVLTAAHCLVNTDNMKLQPGDIKVGLGKYHRSFYKKESSSLITDVREIVIPQVYSGQASFFALDIGLLDLVISVQVTAFIMPACVDWSSVFRPTPNATGFVAGWGKTEFGTSSETVLSARLKFIGYDDCLRNIRGAYQRYLTHDKFCAGNLDGSQVDKGDSGGGLTFVKNGQHFLIGIVSTKIPQETSFSLFTDITNTQHSTWLETERTRLKASHRES